MRTASVSILIALSILIGTAAAAHAAPTISFSDPSTMVQDAPSYPRVHGLTIFGTGLALSTTNGSNWRTDVEVWLMDPAHGWTRTTATDPWVRDKSWNTSQISLDVIGLPSSGTLSVAVKVGGVWSNVLAIPIRAYSYNPPVLTYIERNTFYKLLSGPLGTLYFEATHLNDSNTCVLFQNSAHTYLVTSFARINAGANWGEVYVPDLPLGTYWMQVSNDGCSPSHDWSNAKYLYVKFFTYHP